MSAPAKEALAAGQWVLASGNAKKRAELSRLLSPLGLRLVSQSELGIPDAEEPHHTFLENALAKARHASAASGLPAIADDSGLVVDALQGAPGVRSARYAADALASGRLSAQWLAQQGLGLEPASDEANWRWLLAELAERGLVPEQCVAAFVTVVVAVRHAQDPFPLVALGRWPGRLLSAPRGQGGFGYDPIFLDPELGLSAAEMSPDQKDARSHRGQALRSLLQQLDPDSAADPLAVSPARV